MTFDEIVNSISDAEFKKTLLRGQYELLRQRIPSELRDQYMRAIEKELPVGALTGKRNPDALINIAYVARAIARMHPGWEEWDKDPESHQMKKRFMKAIESLYNGQASVNKGERLEGEGLLGALYKVVGELKDNHLEVFATQQRPNGDVHYYHPVDQKTKLIYRPETKGNVGENVAYRYDHDDENTHVFHLGTPGNKRPIVFAKRIINGQETAIIGLSTCMVQHGTHRQASEEDAFQKVVQALKDNLSKVKNVIIDVRGGEGGIPDYLQQMAGIICKSQKTQKLVRHPVSHIQSNQKYKTTEIPCCSRSQDRKTWEAKLRMQFYYKPREFGKKNQLMSYPGRQKVFVLMDRETGSASEFAYPLFRQYRGTQFIGENTKGICQYGEVNYIALPCGGALRMGTTFCDFGTGPVEGKGFSPDINCSGRDAFQVACERIGQGNTLQTTLSCGASEGKSLFDWMKKFVSFGKK